MPVLFLVACGLGVLFATGHFFGFLAARHAARTDPALADLTRAMRAHVTPLAGFRPSILDFREYFSAAFSPMLLAVVALALLAVWFAGDRAAAVRAVSVACAALMIVLLGLSVVYHVFQGIVSCGLIALLFAASALWSR